MVLIVGPESGSIAVLLLAMYPECIDSEVGNNKLAGLAALGALDT
jgi:hypothetical protein